MSLINISNLNFTYEGSYDPVFKGVSLQLDTNWRTGLIGRNGKGKTTFLRLLQGKYSYQGSITADTHFDYFPFPIADEDLMPMELLPWDTELWQLQRELSLMGSDEELLYRPMKTLSGGEKTRVMLAMLFARENNFLLIDEPTNHLDIQARRQISEYLQRKNGFILVSHDRTLLDSCIDHVLSINRADIEVQKGNFSSWYNNRQAQDRFEMAENEKRKKEISRLEVAARQSARWSDKIEQTKNGQKVSGLKPDKGYIGHQAAKMMKRSKNAERRRTAAVEEKSKLLKNLEQNFPLKLEGLQYHNHSLIAMNDLAICYGENTVCQNVTFEVHQGERIALQGKNGSGKSSLLKLIMGEPLTFSGSLRIGSQLKISYVQQHTDDLQGHLSDYAKKYGIDESRFKAILNKMDFTKIQFEKVMEDFSQGQKKKVLLARSLCEKAHLYVWDEPLNYIDVFSRMQIEELILEFKPTLLFVEHDQAFTEKVATGKMVLDNV